VRADITLFLAASICFADCGTQPPCYAVAPGLVVAIAESLEDYDAPKYQRRTIPRKPIRMRLCELVYGPSPGAEFTFEWWGEYSLHKGQLVYIEETVTLLRASNCGQTELDTHMPVARKKYFQELTAGQHQETYVRIGFQQAPISAIRLSGPNGVIEQYTDARGLIEWHNLPPGRYTVHTARSGQTMNDRSEAAPVIHLLPGSCALVLFEPKPPA
jgi:hypothetical protein